MKSILIFFTFFFVFLLRSQVDSAFNKNVSFFAFPVVGYAPETKTIAGVYGFVNFKLPSDSSETRTSSVQIALAYTQLKQILLFFPYQIWTKGNKLNIFGELGYYKYTYFNWGIGNDTKEQEKNQFDAIFPRFRISALIKVGENSFFGPRYGFDSYKISFQDTNSLPLKENYTGSTGGIVSSLGLTFKFDNRDNQFTPTKGKYLELSINSDQKFTGSSYKNLRGTLDASTYLKLNKSVFAFNGFMQLMQGEIPFYQLSLLGGNKRMRGYFEGRYRDQNMLVFQSEYRFNIYKRLGATCFGSIGNVFNSAKNLIESRAKFAYGLGLRFLVDKKQGVNLRLDCGIAENKPAFYLTFSEAF